jgi:hypothetical protein
MKLVITIDTEEDDWGRFSSTGHTLENIDRIPQLQALFDEYKIKPTYLITYPVATDNKSIDLLMQIEKSGRCEIGSHCHPWNTPPFEEDLNEKNSMLCNLGRDLQYKKMHYLHNTISSNLDVKPVSFRSGRYGYDQDVAENLLKLGYKVDTSITSYTDWRDCQGPDFSEISPRPFRFSCNNIFKATTDGPLMEIPATIAFLQKNFETSNLLIKRLKSGSLGKLGIIGILHKLNLLNKVWLSPEMSDSRQMVKLTQCLMKKDYEVINMFFHSTTLQAGLNSFVETKSDEQQFFKRIKDFLAFAKDSGIESIKLSDTIELFPVK